MGRQDVSGDADEQAYRAFMRALLADVHALETMIDEGRIETGIRRIGAEQEMFLVDDGCQPAPVSPRILDSVEDARLTTELAQYNIEANLSPQVFGGHCLANMERELEELIGLVNQHAEPHGASAVLTGILPTLRVSDLSLDNMTPGPRYAALNKAALRMRGGDFHVVIKGVDELDLTHDNVMLESANTSFQIHFQAGPDEFTKLYNLAQFVTAPVLAVAVNSPTLLGRKLWQETRIALFQHSVDTRSSAQASRQHPPRVSFGDDWLKESILEIYREDIARFRVILAIELDEDPAGELAKGILPQLSALRLHTGTVWRWNRACFGSDGKTAHLRIENRVLPAGPTVLDEVANAAFFFGLMARLIDEYDDVSRVVSFDDAKANFFAAARHGLGAQFQWANDRTVAASELILDHLLPSAREGLEHANIAEADIDRYLGTIEERARSQRTGSRWMLQSLAKLESEGTATTDVRMRALTASMRRWQRESKPIHAWPLAELPETADWRHSFRRVSQFMTTDLFTVRPEDLVDLAASVMDWKHIRHVPVEDEQGRLVGIVSHRALLRLVARGRGSRNSRSGETVVVQNIMKRDPVTATPETPTLEAMALMRQANVGCLPVIDEDRKLVGLVTTTDLLEVARKLMEKYLADDASEIGEASEKPTDSGESNDAEGGGRER